MSSPDTLQQQVNETLSCLHDFAKWKLITVSGLAATATGFADREAHWLLIFVPFACAYVDLNCYQYLIRIFVISRYFKERAKGEFVGDYERVSGEAQEEGLFKLGLIAGIGASLAFSFLLPAYAYFDASAEHSRVAGGIVWALGIAAVVACYLYYRRKCKTIELLTIK